MNSEKTKRGRPNKGSSGLNAQSILICAKALMTQASAPPSIRKLAQALDVDAMAIYHYYKNKSALLEAIAVSLIDEIYTPKKDQDWQAELLELSHSYLSLLAKYPGLLDTLLSMNSDSPAKVFAERFKTILLTLELTAEKEKIALDLLADYLHGYALAMSCNTALKLDKQHLSGPIKIICLGLSFGMK